MANQKTLSERVLQNVASLPTLGRANKNMALFLGQKDEIAQALSDGWSVKAVWMTLSKEGSFPGTYACFRLYVARFIHSQKEPQTAGAVRETPEKKTEPERPQTADKFEFSGTPNEKELI